MLRHVAISTILTLAIIYIVPFAIYSIFSIVTGLQPPAGGSPTQFLVIVFVAKVGTALAFVLIFYFARPAYSNHWLLYAFIWWLMLVIGEIGQAIGPEYSWLEAIAGIIAETVYCPLSAFVVNGLIGRNA